MNSNREHEDASLSSEKETSAGNIHTCEEFLEEVKCYCIMDYDGIGYYLHKDGTESSRNAVPSVIFKKGTDPNYTHIVWYNK